MADFSFGQLPDWMQGLGRENRAVASRFGDILGTGLAATTIMATQKSLPDPVTGESHGLSFPEALGMARLNQVDPMWGIKAQQMQVNLLDQTAKLKSNQAALDQQIQDSTAWLHEAPNVAKWLKLTPDQRKTAERPEVTSSKGISAMRGVDQQDQRFEIQQQANEIKNQAQELKLQETRMTLDQKARALEATQKKWDDDRNAAMDRADKAYRGRIKESQDRLTASLAATQGQKDMDEHRGKLQAAEKELSEANKAWTALRTSKNVPDPQDLTDAQDRLDEALRKVNELTASATAPAATNAPQPVGKLPAYLRRPTDRTTTVGRFTVTED